MTTKVAISTVPMEATGKASHSRTTTPYSSDRLVITPAERWMFICQNVYTRGQRRGFVGGDPLQDLADAEVDVDATYETDFRSVFSLTSTAEITEQLKGLFASYGFDREHVDGLLGGHQEGLERLAAMNRGLLGDTSELAVRQSQRLSDVAGDAVRTLYSLTQGGLRPETAFHEVDLSLQILDNALSVLCSPTPTDRLQSDLPQTDLTQASGLLRRVIVDDCQDCTPRELADAPVTALRGVCDSLGKRLFETFRIRTVRDLANHPHANWASGIVLLADSVDYGQTASIADAPLSQVPGISHAQILLLDEAFGIRTVRDLANHRWVSTARAIVLLAELVN